MTHRLQADFVASPELIEDGMLCIEDLARLCCVSTTWVQARLLDELLIAERREGELRFPVQPCGGRSKWPGSSSNSMPTRPSQPWSPI